MIPKKLAKRFAPLELAAGIADRMRILKLCSFTRALPN
jgi:hypothetical protein